MRRDTVVNVNNYPYYETGPRLMVRTYPPISIWQVFGSPDRRRLASTEHILPPAALK